MIKNKGKTKTHRLESILNSASRTPVQHSSGVDMRISLDSRNRYCEFGM